VRDEVVGALELGGTHVTAARVSTERRAVEASTLRRAELTEDASRDAILATIRTAAVGAASTETRRWGVATPGPFDYERGISTIRGVAKLEALYGVDLRSELATALTIRADAIRFLNDADAFLLGEWWAGAARGHEVAMGITLGSGLGSAFMRGGALLQSGPGVPADARLDLVPFRGRPVEDVISRRGMLAAYRRTGREASEVVEIARRAGAGERAALETFDQLGSALGEFLAPYVERFAPSCLLFGGSIARAWPLFVDAFSRACAPAARVAMVGVAEHLGEAPLLGAARYAITS
jgi:predicted NBD/HSP70 family sugar kinase